MMHKRKLLNPRVVGMAILLMCLWTMGILASDGNAPDGNATTPPAESTAKPSANSDDQVNALKHQMALQQKQIEQMQKSLEQQKQLLEKLTKPAAAPQQAAQPAAPAKPAAPVLKAAQPAPQAQTDAAPQPAAQSQAPSLGQVASTTPMIPQSQTKVDNTIGTASATAPIMAPNSNAAGDQETSPLQLHIGDATLTPVGFMDFTGVFRSKEAGGNIGTSFGSIPYATVTGGLTPVNTNLSEIRMSIQNSRIGFRVDADVHNTHVIGYMEADFLGTPASTNIAVTNNAQLLRNRLYWVDLRHGGWEILGGQTWSLITPGRVGISPLPSDVFYTQDMDVNYQAGLFWGRIPELRFAYHLPSEKAAFAIAIDSPDQYGGGSSGGASITLPSALSTTYASELDFGASSGGIATPDVAPDVIAKLALDPSKRVHFEIGGVERTFKVYNPGVAAVAATSSTPAVAGVSPASFTMEGGGGFVNIHAEIFKGFRLMTNNIWGAGIGRYLFGQAPDVIAHADGSLSPVHSGSTVTGFEYTHKNTLIFAYYGGIYIMRNTAVDAGKTTAALGYGYSGSSSSQNRDIQEITFGFNQAIWKHPKYGAVNIIGQYSYLLRDPWYVNFAKAQPANANDNMVFLDLRYTLPGSAPTLGRPAR
jgi:hypothetical protein